MQIEMRKFILCVACVVALSVSLSSQGADAGQPPSLNLPGPVTIPMIAQASRAHLLGAIRLYTIAIYANGPFDPVEMVSPDIAKALRIEVTYEEDLRQRTKLDWHGELVPRLEPAAAAHLRGSFAALKQGDVVIVEFLPGKGTTVRVNKAVAVSGSNHDLMLAFLDHWMGQRPVSEEIKRCLLGRC